MNNKLKIFMACWASVIVLVIIIGAFMVLFGMEAHMQTFFYIHFSIGIVIVFIIFWPIYSKRLK